ncbi:hypothetical protein IE81DRAFT_363505 [Ceraceosorus guamensis]|uniref:alpha,alpha-trehalase n=1 Tax=Ceraceosorus guamensis TaxID=1522189 RepID=A0A316W847_9BASI|nr:hypothetical protein IE81DRAFT_363505 [Ceraceosorus guamensis]PWN46080.1 hypothetical protein IE81DRAFT_363505 [Ceraceosorus guamensis]
MKANLLLQSLAICACAASPFHQQSLHASRGEGQAAPVDSSQADNAAFNWTQTLTSYEPNSWQSQPYVSNGYIGARLPASGFGFHSIEPSASDVQNGGQGWPLFGPRVTANMVAGFYDVQASTIGTNFPQTGGESVISLLPTWTGLYLTVGVGSANESTFSIATPREEISEFEQSLSLRNGTVITRLLWKGLRLSYTAITHRSIPELGLIRLDVEANEDADASLLQSIVISDVLDGRGAARVEGEGAGTLNSSDAKTTIHSTVSPAGVPNVTAWEFSTFSTLISNASQSAANEQTFSAVELPESVAAIINASVPSTSHSSFRFEAAHRGISVWKAVGIASTDAFSDPRAKALNASTSAVRQGWTSLVESHRQAWEDIWSEGGDIVVHSDSVDAQDWQRTTRASLFHLLANVRSSEEGRGLGDNSIAPSGLTSDSYAGSVFWDAETWMFPSLLSLYPKYAESILLYRHKQLEQIEANAKQYNLSGLLYPWVSARYQNCTGVGPCYNYEYHLNTDIALAHWQHYQQTGNRTFLERYTWPILRGVSEMFASLVNRTEDGGYRVLNATAPDEYANRVDAEAFTDAGVEVTLNDAIEAAGILGLQDQVPANWSSIANNMTVLTTDTPSNNTVVLEFEGFNGSIVIKQADVTLLTYPLEVSKNRQPDPLADLEYYSGATSPNGPGMTWSIYSIVASALSESGCEAYSRLQESWKPYERPFGQFSEQTTDDYNVNGGTNPAYTFLTGHGGYLQVWTHGMTGYRSRSDVFYLDPSLPPQLAPGGYTVKGMRHRSSRLDVTVAGDNTTIAHTTGDAPVRVEIGARNERAGNYTLNVGEDLTVPTTRIDLFAPSYAGNLAQCGNATSQAEVMPGGYAFAANDGSNATAWSPVARNGSQGEAASNVLLLDLGQSPRDIKSIHINWAKYPASQVSVSTSANANAASDSTLLNSTAVTNRSVTISAPYNETGFSIVDLRVGNTTDLQLVDTGGPPINARFVAISISNTSATPGVPPTIAEAVVLA